MYLFWARVLISYCALISVLGSALSPQITGTENVGLILQCIETYKSYSHPDPVHIRNKRRVEARQEQVKEEEGEGEGEKEEEEKRKYKRLEHDIKIRGEIRSRYAITLVENTVLNPEPVHREVFFSVIIPETAFISKFAMEVGGQVYLAEVKEKEEALKLYKDAVEEGKSAGHVGVSARHSNRFKVSVNTQPGEVVRFYLLYEELLKRKGGVYNYIINISPHQKLSNYVIDVNIAEQKNISRINVPKLKKHFIDVEKEDEEEQLKDSEILLSPSSGGSARVLYNPDIHHLQEQVKEGPLQFMIEYEVERGDKGGELDLYQGYFVHFVAPENLPPMPKHVVFVLDTSGSMRYRKMQQTVNAMNTIVFSMRYRKITTFDLIWTILTTFDLIWTILTTFDLIWTILTTFDLIWTILTIFDLIWPILTIFDLIWTILTTFDLIWTILTTFD
ncbi:inter-alpha-trypsin inhibitor heavy chain H6 [Eurytemora carolleeae]|uniref:inter-alpha-trypsin inhibitor heavy chain H6 n=1 Tax=Eurytemora carolleeae TaxID=1294199 RepID=UPI000C76838D|nr:inter-alpha-trypsin inhibitor heavy chain H6 [Eurytemora carolleeae]|eukprot:XP_023341336.1 inter-alpha-trypsin inhibitor heavy chain H6-like [Eurytemora affinis]